MAPHLDNTMLLLLDYQLSLGVIALDPACRVVSRNDAAAAMLDDRDGVLLDRGRLVASNPEHAGALPDLLVSACAAGAGPTPAGGAVEIARRTPRRPLTVIAVPLRWSDLPEPFTMPAALVLLSDPERTPPRLDSVLARRYGLTRSEADVALLVVSGARTEDVARLRNTSLHTARTHVKRVLAKVGVQSQVELVRLLLAGPVQSSQTALRACSRPPSSVRGNAVEDIHIRTRLAR